MKTFLLKIGALFLSATLFFTACKDDPVEIVDEVIENGETDTAGIRIDQPLHKWRLASTPVTDAFEYATLSNDWRYNFDRAQIAWYKHDIFVCSGQPSCFDSHYTRNIPPNELDYQSSYGFGNSGSIYVMQIAYFPNERGPYNYNVDELTPDGNLTNPEIRWSGLQRSLDHPNFETSNFKFIEFWMLDPLLENPSNTGSFYINLGTVSEDVLKDGHCSVENALAYSRHAENSDTTIWARVSKNRHPTTPFFGSPDARKLQDMGLDGVNNDGERVLFKQYLDDINARVDINPSVIEQINNDPANDDCCPPINSEYAETIDIIERYKYCNNPQGNSIINANNLGFPNQTNYPDTEDINNDKVLQIHESFYQYKIELKPGMKAGDQYIIEVKENEIKDSNGTTARWYKFQIPISDFDEAVGGIDQFTNIQFMRLYLTDFKNPVVLRLADFNLIRIIQR